MMTHPLLPPQLQVFAAIILVSFLGWAVHLVRHKGVGLREILAWVLSTAAVLAATAFPQILLALAQALRIEVPSNALFAVAILFLAVNLFSTVISLSATVERTRRLAQECAVLRAEVEALRGRSGEGAGDGTGARR
jgi:hypothetical protein